MKNSSPPLTGSQLLANNKLTASQLSVICWLTVGQLSANSLLGYLLLGFAKKITACRTSDGQQLTDCLLNVNNLSVRCWYPFGRM